MKKLSQLIAVWLLLFVFAFPSNAESSLWSQEENLLSIIQDFRQRYKVHFTYDREIVEDVKVGHYEPDSYAGVDDAMAKVLENTNLKYVLLESKYVIIYQDDAEGMKSVKKIIDVLQQIIDHRDKEDFIAKVPSVSAHLQSPVSIIRADDDVVVTGKVTNGIGDPLIGATILIKGSTIGTATDLDGNFEIQGVEENSILIFSYTGYETLEVPVAGQTMLTVVLVESSKILDEIVVVGYGSTKKSDLTGSVASVSEDEIRSVPGTRLDQALQGRAAGVQVTQTDASPGGNVRIRIRGGNSLQAGNDPLYVIDGFAGANNLNSINPSDIQSIEILKDASATAIYGARGANGVVIITTKRGVSGESRVSFDATYSMQKVRKKIDMLNGTQFAEMVNEARINDGLDAYYADPQSFGEGTDWQDEIYRTGRLANYQLSFSGGSDKIKYSLSGNHTNQEGIIENSTFERNSLRINLDSDISSKFKIGSSLAVSKVTDSRVGVNTSRQATNDGVVIQALLMHPTVPVYDAEGNYSLSEPFFDPLSNPVAKVLEPLRNDNVTRALGNVYGEFAFTDKLKLRISGGADLFSGKNNFYEPRTTFLGAGTSGLARIQTVNSNLWQNENTLSYSSTVGRHSVNAVVGYVQQGYRFENLTANSEGFINDNLTYNSLQTASNTRPTNTGADSWDLQSYLARINYIFDDKYLLTFTGRADGSSKFGKNNKWGIFPSGAFAWRLSEEDFVKDMGVFDDLKVRASYGITGNQEIGSYRSLSELESGANYIIGNELAIGLFPSNVANPNLKWERTAQFDVGLDMGFFNTRLTVTADYYFKKTTDLLYNVVLPVYTGYSSSLQNLGSLQNKGVEISVSSINTVGDFDWSTDFNISFNRSKVLDLGPDTELFTSGSFIPDQATVGIIRVGEPIGLFYGYTTDGLFQEGDIIEGGTQPDASPGDQKYIDINGDGVFNTNDRSIIGNPNPDFIYGLTNDFSYKGISLNLFIQGVMGGDVLNVNRSVGEFPNGTVNNFATVLDRWTPSNTDATIPRASVKQSRRLKDLWIEDGSYLRLKNVSLSYDLPYDFVQKLKVQGARISLSGQNLITLTDYTGFDPEVNSLGSNNLVLAVDFGSYPNVKTYTFGLKVDF